MQTAAARSSRELPFSWWGYYLQRECGLTQGNLSSRLSKLEEAGYVVSSKTFKGIYPPSICSLARKGRVALAGYSDKMRFVTNASPEGDPSGLLVKSCKQTTSFAWRGVCTSLLRCLLPAHLASFSPANPYPI